MISQNFLSSKELWSLIICDAIDKKYKNISISIVSHWIDNAINKSRNINDLDGFIKQSLIVSDAETDVHNQTLALLFIEKSLEYENIIQNPLTNLHRILKGPVKDMVRSAEKVADFQDKIPTPLNEAFARFHELEHCVSILLQTQGMANRQEQFLILSYIFSSIIRIHYFADGNGRIARMAIQWLSRRWSLPHIRIPKVRNDQTWKQSLHLALNRNYSALATEMEKRVF